MALTNISFLGAMAGCGDGPTQPKISHSPVCSLYTPSPISGVAPLEVRLQGGGTDQDGDFRNYKVMLNGNYLTGTNPIDTTVTLNNNSTLSAECSDMVGHVVNTTPINVTVLQPSFSQTLSLSDSTNIIHNVNLVNIQKAESRMFRNDSLISIDTITGLTYSKRISNAPKGTYMSILTSNNPLVKPDTATVIEPDYLPTLNTTGLDLTIDEGGQIGFNLESRVHDTNLEDSVYVLSAVPTDLKTQVYLNEDSITIRALGNATGAFGIRVDIGNDKKSVPVFLQGNIYDLPTISGNLQSNESWQGIQGTLRAYTLVNNILTLKKDTIPLMTQNSDSAGNNLTDSNGNFSFTIKERNLENILVMAREGTPNNYQGYVRTISIPGKDTGGVLIRAVPYGQYANNPEVFPKFMQELASDIPNTRFDFNGEFIPGFGGFQGIEILGQNPFGAQYGTFTPQQQELIRDKILDPNDINGLVQNRIKLEDILMGNFGHHTLDSANQKIIPDSGWITVVPYSNLGVAGLTDNYKAGTIVYKGIISLRSSAVNSMMVISHEFGHMFIGSKHPISINPNESVMTLTTTLNNTGPADKKAGMLVYEPTFMIFSELEYPNVDYLWNILRTDFK